jgi:hypothetical protein
MVILQVTLEFVRFFLLELRNFLLFYRWQRGQELVGKG